MYVKVCGITRPEELNMLERLPVDLVGLWHGVPGGRADLSLAECQRLVAVACVVRNLEPVLVTFINQVEALREVIHQSRVRWIQLHGYQPPSLVRAVKKAFPQQVYIIKALHIQGPHCLEAPLIHAYERAGVDVFLFDAATADGRIGSTGQSLDGSVVLSLVKQLTRPFFLAGGINSENWREHAKSVRGPGWLGIDVDTNARGPDGKLRPESIESIVQAWTTCAKQGCYDV